MVRETKGDKMMKNGVLLFGELRERERILLPGYFLLVGSSFFRRLCMRLIGGRKAKFVMKRE